MNTTTISTPASAPAAPTGRTTHPLWLRITHWLNLLAVVVMVMSGWRIYNASPLFEFTFPAGVTIGGWLGGALQWHFAAMWLLAINGLLYLLFNAGTGRLVRKFFPISPRAVIADLIAALKGKLGHDDLSHYNAVQRAAYLFAVVDLVVLVISGLVLWKSVQFPILRTLLGGYDAARYVHFVAMVLLLAFVVVHVVMAVLVPRTVLAMLRGR